LLQHFEIAPIGGYPVTAGMLAGLILVIITTKHPNWLALGLVTSAVTFACSLAAITDSAADIAHFFRTYGLVMVVTLIVTIALTGSNSLVADMKNWSGVLMTALIAIVILSVAQVITGALGSSALFNIFGSHQYLYPYNPYLAFNPIPRAQGLFLEPSYDAFVIGSLSVALLAIGSRKILVTVLAAIGLAACQSATGLVVLFAIVALVALRSRPAAGISLVIAGWGFYTYAGQYLVGRLGSITVTASSGNYRLLAPLAVLRDVIDAHPLGRALGSIQGVVSGYGLQNGADVGSSLDNGFYVIVYYFGWLGIVGILAWISITFVMMVRSIRASGGLAWIVPSWILATMFFSGGIVLPEFALMTWMVLVSYKQAGGSSRETDPEPHYSDNHHGVVQRHRRTAEDAEFA
jgi:putative colanic acid polymerase